MPARYQQNYGAFGRLVLRSESMRAAMATRAEKVKAEFAATAPVGSPHEHDADAGHYRDSATVESGTDGGPKHDRAFGKVTVHDEAAMSIEYGHTAEFDEHGRFARRGEGVRAQYVDGSYTLTRALDAAGDD